MKSYQEWNNENCATNCGMCVPTCISSCKGVGTREDVWRAAYESILNKFRISESKSNIIKFIDEELNE